VAATERLLDGGALGAITTRRIAQHAGVSEGVLYNHFGDKRDLLIAALLRRYARLVEAFEAKLPVAGEATVDANLRSFATALRDLESDALLLGAALLTDPALLARFWAEIHRTPFGIDRLHRPLADYLRAERAGGRIRHDVDVAAVTTLLFGASAMNALTRRLNPGLDREGLDRDLDSAIAVVAGAVTPGPGASR